MVSGARLFGVATTEFAIAVLPKLSHQGVDVLLHFQLAFPDKNHEEHPNPDAQGNSDAQPHLHVRHLAEGSSVSLFV